MTNLSKLRSTLVIGRFAQVAVLEIVLFLAAHLICDQLIHKDHKHYKSIKRGINAAIAASFFILFGFSLNLETTPIEVVYQRMIIYFYELSLLKYKKANGEQELVRDAKNLLKPVKNVIKPLLGDDCRLKVLLEPKNRISVFCESHVEKYPRFAGYLRPELIATKLKTSGKGFNRMIELTRVQFNPDGVLALKDHMLERSFKLTYPAHVPPEKSLDYAYGKVRTYMESFLLNMHQKEAFYGPLETQLKEQIALKAKQATSTFKLMQTPNSSEIIEPVKEFILNTVTQNITKTPLR
jgi:hypothetical protein